MEKENEEINVRRLIRKIVFWTFGIMAILWVLNIVFMPFRSATGVLEKSMNADNIIYNYEEFQNIWNTCNKLNVDLGNMKSVPENDVMFQQFSKAQRVLAIKTSLNRWIEEYNAKSKMLNRKYWKSPSLPYQLEITQFSNY